MNVNKAFILGNLTRDPEMRTLPSGQPVCSFAIATNRFFTKNGEKQKQAEFHNVVMFGRLAEIAKQYLTKGSLVFVEGRIQTRSWQGQDGQKKWRTEVVAEQMQLGPRNSGGGTPREATEDSKPQTASKPAQEELETINYGDEEINPDEIPF